jgi:hypothetical protein
VQQSEGFERINPFIPVLPVTQNWLLEKENSVRQTISRQRGVN